MFLLNLFTVIALISKGYQKPQDLSLSSKSGLAAVFYFDYKLSSCQITQKLSSPSFAAVSQ
jgi:hypothetical protein